VRYLTRQEWTVLALVILLMVTGLTVKMYRTAHPPKGPGLGASPANAAAPEAKL
jgi:hypothetical protein